MLLLLGSIYIVTVITNRVASCSSFAFQFSFQAYFRLLPLVQSTNCVPEVLTL
jgi:hypothetical protein